MYKQTFISYERTKTKKLRPKYINKFSGKPLFIPLNTSPDKFSLDPHSDDVLIGYGTVKIILTTYPDTIDTSSRVSRLQPWSIWHL